MVCSHCSNEEHNIFLSSLTLQRHFPRFLKISEIKVNINQNNFNPFFTKIICWVSSVRRSAQNGRKTIAAISPTYSTRGRPCSSPARLHGHTRSWSKRVWSACLLHHRYYILAFQPLHSAGRRLVKVVTVNFVCVLHAYRLNLVESQLWNEDNWRGKYIGVVPRRGKEDKVPFRNLSINYMY